MSNQLHIKDVCTGTKVIHVETNKEYTYGGNCKVKLYANWVDGNYYFNDVGVMYVRSTLNFRQSFKVK